MITVAVLGKIKDPRAVEPLIAALRDRNHKVRVITVAVLGEIKDPRAVEHLIAALKDLNSEIRLKAIEALGKTKEPSAVELLIGALKDEEVQRSIVVVLKELTGNYFGFDQEKWHKWWEENKDTYLKKK
jgi:HEAT repeat protein